MGVLVVDGVGLVADVGRGERVAAGVRRARLVLQVHLHRAGGGRPGGVAMLALSMWAPSGRPEPVRLPAGVGAVVGLGVDRVAALAVLAVVDFSWKLPAASVKPIGAFIRWSCQLLTK